MPFSIRTITTLIASIGLGLIAVALTRVYVSKATRTPTEITGAIVTVPVVVAARPLERGAVLQPEFLKVVSFPQESVPTKAFHSIGQLTGSKDEQRLALRSLVANEPILPANVSGPGGKLNLSGLIAPGMRAVSLRSNDVAGVGGFVLPGDRVDVLLTRATGTSAENNTVTQILAEDVRVLGVDQSANDEADKPVVSKAVTVEVTPEQAQSISLGQSVGTVSLTLRHVADDAPLTRKTMSVNDLGPAPHKSTGQPAGPAVRVIRGVDASKFSFAVEHGLEQTAAQVPAGIRTP